MRHRTALLSANLPMMIMTKSDDEVNSKSDECVIDEEKKVTHTPIRGV